jgi:PAS domain S-box-containing protein
MRSGKSVPDCAASSEPHGSRIHPEDLTRIQGVFATLLAKQDAVAMDQCRYQCRDGSYKWMEFVAVNRVHDPDIAGLLLNYHDVSERKEAEAALAESEARYRAQFDLASEGIFTLSPAGVIVDVNAAFAGMHGYTRAEMMNMSLKDLDTAASSKLVPERMRRLLSGEVLTFEVEHLHKDGHAFPMEVSASLVVSGGPPALLCFHRDITERKQAEEEKAKLQAQLQQSQKMESLGTLAGGVAHDMNNVLGAILSLASAHIGTQPYGSPLHKALDTICKATERGGKMVKSLLSFARQSPAENHKLDMNAILREQVSLLERTTLATVRLHLDLEAELRPILGEAGALAHAFMNLCVNAVDAMPENGILTLHSRNVDNGWIEVEVEDNGMGMPKEVLEKAMDPFFTTKEVGKGTGLGLSMVFSTVMAHRGQMAIESEPGQGTRVRLRFPACDQEAPAQAALPAMVEDVVLPRGSLKVLLVDDDDLIQSSMQAIFEVLGHTAVTTALNGEEALALLEAGLEPDLVILDMNMPGLGGAGTLPRLRVLHPTVPVLLATGRVDQMALTLASAHPGVTLLSKPFGLRELQKHLENIGLG